MFPDNCFITINFATRVSEKILNGTSAQFSGIHDGCSGKYRRLDKLKIQKIHKLIQLRKSKKTQKNSKQNYPGSVAFYDTWPGNEPGLFYNVPKPTHQLQ